MRKHHFILAALLAATSALADTHTITVELDADQEADLAAVAAHINSAEGPRTITTPLTPDEVLAGLLVGIPGTRVMGRPEVAAHVGLLEARARELGERAQSSPDRLLPDDVTVAEMRDPRALARRAVWPAAPPPRPDWGRDGRAKTHMERIDAGGPEDRHIEWSVDVHGVCWRPGPGGSWLRHPEGECRPRPAGPVGP